MKGGRINKNNGNEMSASRDIFQRKEKNDIEVVDVLRYMRKEGIRGWEGWEGWVTKSYDE